MPNPERVDSADLHANNDLLCANFLPSVHRSLLGIFLHLLTSVGGCVRERAPEINMADILADISSSWCDHGLCHVRLLPGQRWLALGCLLTIHCLIALHCWNSVDTCVIHGYQVRR